MQIWPSLLCLIARRSRSTSTGSLATGLVHVRITTVIPFKLSNAPILTFWNFVTGTLQEMISLITNTIEPTFACGNGRVKVLARQFMEGSFGLGKGSFRVLTFTFAGRIVGIHGITGGFRQVSLYTRGRDLIVIFAIITSTHDIGGWRLGMFFIEKTKAFSGLRHDPV